MTDDRTAQQDHDQYTAALHRIGLPPTGGTDHGGGPINPRADRIDALHDRTEQP